MVCRLPEFNYQIRSGVAHTLQTARDGDDMFENLKPILYAMSSIIFFTTHEGSLDSDISVTIVSEED